MAAGTERGPALIRSSMDAARCSSSACRDSGPDSAWASAVNCASTASMRSVSAGGRLAAPAASLIACHAARRRNNSAASLAYQEVA
ncbi:hypothetical protein G6F50_017081 [Rhizopus delemar]|uniref:Uncharacterized protein n=1 Tax=Rhizopus delemar TaxID=936053 RepID=A0A9P7C0S7_9FUNG|nr:hypothetical protein G6F50_017081 [Rhizopus delemar]